jgi:FAD:protein FMN transferase
MSQDVCLALEAMGTRFELVLNVCGGIDVRAAGEEALAEIARLESHMSFYRADSDVTWINAHARQRPVKVEPELFRLLQRCQELSAATEGAFDITIGPLMRAWRFVDDSGAVPTSDVRAQVLQSVGYRHLMLDAASSTVRFARQGMSIDLGSAAKGYAIDRAIGILRARGITGALLHGGTSSVHVVGPARDAAPWRVAWRSTAAGSPVFGLRNCALSVSAVHGKAFTAHGHVYGHVMDPRSGQPTECAASAVVSGPASLECDALSTALLVLGAEWIPTLGGRFLGYAGAVAARRSDDLSQVTETPVGPRPFTPGPAGTMLAARMNRE